MIYPQTSSNQYNELSYKIKCPKCSQTDFWKTNDGRLKCKNCRYLFTPKSNPLNISNQLLTETISDFLLEHSTNIILERINISKYKLLKTLTFLRTLMSEDIPEVLQKIIRLKIENYLNNAKREIKNYRNDNNMRHLALVIFCKEGLVYAKTLPNFTTDDLKFFLKGQKSNNLVNAQASWQKYFGLVFRHSLYRLSSLNDKRHKVDTMEGFWGYLKRKLAAKGGIRSQRLSLYLGEYAWRYNHQKMTLREKEKYLLKLVFSSQKKKFVL